MAWKGPLTAGNVLAALVRHGWILSDAARALAVSRQALYKAVRRYGITLPDRSDLRFRRRGGRPRTRVA